MRKIYFSKAFESFDFKDKKTWKKEGNGYRLVKKLTKEDRCFAEVSYIKELGNKSILNPEEKLSIAGVANGNIIDRTIERLDPRGCVVEHYLKNPVLLLGHDYDKPIGQVEVLDIQDDGVHFQAWIGDPKSAPLTEDQIKARSLIAQKIFKAVSVGFIPLKIIPPSFANDGTVTEPLIIEQWEMLELSVVAVPCNPVSLFEMKNQKSLTQETISLNETQENISEVIKGSETIQCLIFSKEKFGRDGAQEWAIQNEYISDKIDETDDGYRLTQADASEFEQDSMRTINLIEGVKMTVGKQTLKKDGDVAPPAPASDTPKEVIAMLTQISESQKAFGEKLDAILAAVQKDVAADADEPPAPPAEAEPAKAAAIRVSALEEKVEKLVKLVSALIKQ